MRSSIDRARGPWGRIAAIGLGALLAAASVVPATAAQAAGTTTVHGTVQSGSTKLSGVPVGFWSRTGKRLAGTTTGTTGSFTLRVPSGVRGFAYAGTRPDATKAVFAVGGTSFVRGVIGADQGGTTSYPLYQGHLSATAAGLAGGSDLRFRLQKPGRVRVNGGTYFTGNGPTLGVVDVWRLNGSAVGRSVANRATGTVTSRLLVPGSYRLRAIPQVPYLRRTLSVSVHAGRTTTLSPTFARGATLSGVLTGPGGAPAAGVRVTALVPRSLDRPPSVLSDSTGRYALRGFAAGTVTLRVGYAYPRDPEDDLPPVVPPPTSDDYLPATAEVTVSATHSPVRTDFALRKAGHVTGTVTGTGGRETQVWLETTDHRMIRAGAVTGGTYSLGGLRPGTAYTVYAVGTGVAQDSRYGSASFTATAGTSTRDLTMSTRTSTLSGTLTGGGWVRLRTHGDVLPQLEFTSTLHSEILQSTGRYVVRGLIPGTYDVLRFPGPGNRLVARTSVLTLTGSTTKDFGLTPRPGTYRVRFVSGSAPVHSVSVVARDAAGDEAGISTTADDSANRTGRAVAAGLWPGTYRYSPASFARSFASNDDNVPVVDGPWWFGAISSSFTIRSGGTTDDGTIALHVRAR